MFCGLASAAWRCVRLGLPLTRVCRLETPTVAYRQLAVLLATSMPLVVRGVEDEKTTQITCGPS